MITDAELAELDASVTNACATGDRSGIRLLGHGEVSLVLGWPPDQPVAACKRLPPFPGESVFHEYAAAVERYVASLRTCGVGVVDTTVRRLDRPDGAIVGYLVQPVIPAGSLVTERLNVADTVEGRTMLHAVVTAVGKGTTGRHGVDSQLSNWAWVDGGPVQLDVSTPFLVRPDGGLAFDMGPFLAMLPPPLRPVVRREMTHMVRRWLTVRGSLLDLVSNLFKTGHEAWLDIALDEVNAVVSPPVTRDEARRVHIADRRLWPWLLRAEKAERWWCHTVRHSPYQFLLPERTTYEQST
jgi:hypothetical protein